MKQPVTYRRLSATEREEISCSLAQGKTLGQIGRALRRPPSTISRELSRLRYNSGSYWATFAHEVACRRRNHRMRVPPKLLANDQLRAYVDKHLHLHWSPQQIAARLKLAYPNDMDMRVSHETIYTYIYCLARGELKKELVASLRQQKATRRKPHQASSRQQRFSSIQDFVSIRERPAEVADRIIPGHWEGDLIMGSRNASAIGTLVERTTRTTILVPLKEKDALSVARAFAREMRYLPQQMKLTLTYDRGSEMAKHQLFSSRAKMRVYFADPHSPWQRGTNENTNGLIRQFYPKGTDFSTVSRKQLKHVQHLLNGRPRNVLNFHTPYESFSLLLAEKGGA